MITNKMNKTKINVKELSWHAIVIAAFLLHTIYTYNNYNKQYIDVYRSAFTVFHQIPSYHLHIINYVKITIGNVFLPNLLKLDAINSIIVPLWKEQEERYEIK